MPGNSDKSIVEALFKRYWFQLQQRCRQLLATDDAGDTTARLALAGLLAQEEAVRPDGEWMEWLFKESTRLCVERLSGQQRRHAEWIQTIELATQKEPTPDQTVSDAEADQLERLRALLVTVDRKTRTVAIHHYLDGIDGQKSASLAGLTEKDSSRRLARFRDKANRILSERDQPTLIEPSRGDCPDRLSLDRLLAGEKEGLDQATQHLAEHQECRQREQLRAKGRDESLTDQATTAGCELLERTLERLPARSGPEEAGSFGRKVLLPAFFVAVSAGLFLLIAWPTAPEKEISPVRAQGGYSLEILVDSKAQLREIKPGEVLGPGTLVAFRVGVSRSAVVGLARVGETGPISTVPEMGGSHFMLARGTHQVLPFRYELGPAGRTERMFALFCRKTSEVTFLPQILEHAFPVGPDLRRDPSRDYFGAPETCHIRSVLLTRRKTSVESAPQTEP